MIRWHSLGRLLAPGSENIDWLATHAGAACLRHFAGDHVHFLVSGRNTANHSVLGEIVLELKPFPKVVGIIDCPVFTPGELGCFDDAGVSYPWIVHTENEERLYYTGWTLGVQTPFQNALGLAFRKGDSYVRHSRAPLITRTDEEPFSIGSSCIRKETNQWHMWYTVFDSWQKSESGVEPRYHIRYASSDDGLDWERDGKRAIDNRLEAEECIARPSVSKSDQGYEMYFCQRGKNYRMGMAKSEDGLAWTRLDEEFQFIGSGEKWDDAMNCYPCHFEHQGREYMLYCGNGYGRGGLGIAVKDSS